jgi:hypothetical protein
MLRMDCLWTSSLTTRFPNKLSTDGCKAVVQTLGEILLLVTMDCIASSRAQQQIKLTSSVRAAEGVR